jgi:hypothetical protein
MIGKFHVPFLGKKNFLYAWKSPDFHVVLQPVDKKITL